MKKTIYLNENELNNIIRKSLKMVLNESLNNDFTQDEILNIVSTLKQNPIEEMWKPYNLGFCKVQRIENNEIGGRINLLNKNNNGSIDCYSQEMNGQLYVQIERNPNTNWMEESGYTYMCWK